MRVSGGEGPEDGLDEDQAPRADIVDVALKALGRTEPGL